MLQLHNGKMLHCSYDCHAWHWCREIGLLQPGAQEIRALSGPAGNRALSLAEKLTILPANEVPR